VSTSGPAGQAGAARVLGARPKFTSRAAVLAVVLCAILLTLAYPAREYIAERRLIDQLAAQNAALATQVGQLNAEQRALGSNAYIEQEARDKLHMCFPSQSCFEVIDPVGRHGGGTVGQPGQPWYSRLWESVKEADKAPAR
jgi:cell division protein FtsL